MTMDMTLLKIADMNTEQTIYKAVGVMCEYAILGDSKIPHCAVKDADCTFCVFGNSKTYKSAKEKEIVDESLQNKTKS